jgi:hypothetical protein
MLNEVRHDARCAGAEKPHVVPEPRKFDPKRVRADLVRNLSAKRRSGDRIELEMN